MDSLILEYLDKSITELYQTSGKIVDDKLFLYIDDEFVETEKLSELLSHYNSLKDIQIVLDNRKEAYPSLEDQADMQYWDVVNGTTTWQDAIKAVKDAHPKPN